MKKTFSGSRLLIMIIALAAVVAACGGSAKGGSSATLNGSGSTFQQTFDQVMIQGFQAKDSSVTINYGGGGSGQGKTDLQKNNVQFAGSDSLPKPGELSSYQGGKLLYFPTVAAPITISFKLSGVDKLQLSDKTLAQIFATTIKKWNDPAIRADNPGVTLPSTAITVARRADSSGTTSNFTKFLTAAAPNDWTLGSGDSVDWPAGTQAGQGNPGVAQIVSGTEGAIGYVDFADATAAKLTTASIQNEAGKFVAPTLDGAAAAVASSKFAADLSYSPINASGATSYPITSATYIIVYEKQTDHAQGTALKSFLQFIYTDGQSQANQAGFAPLPAEIVTKATTQLGELQIAA